MSATINTMLTGATSALGTTDGVDPTTMPLAAAKDVRNTHHFIVAGHGSLAANSLGQPWQGDYVFNSGDLVLDLLHNFFLESGARLHKIRVYEMTDHPTARALLGYLLNRGGVHQLAYAKALEQITGVEVPKMLNIPNIPNSRFPEAKAFQDRGEHRTLYRFSPEDFQDIVKVWTGQHPEDGGELVVHDGPPEGAPKPDLPEQPENFVPGYHPGELAEIAQKLMASPGAPSGGRLAPEGGEQGLVDRVRDSLT